MSRDSAGAKDADRPRMKYIAGDPALDFVNTVAWLPDGFASERLSDYGRLIEWCEGAGLLSPAHAHRLRRQARAHPAKAAAALRKAKAVRLVLQRAFASHIARAKRNTGLDELNAALAESLRHLELGTADDGSSVSLVWRWRGLGEDLSSPVWPVLWSAGQLLTSDEADRIRMCAGAGCGWLYVDRSRNHLRRWCEMGVCGTLEKNRRRSTRRDAASDA